MTLKTFENNGSAKETLKIDGGGLWVGDSPSTFLFKPEDRVQIGLAVLDLELPKLTTKTLASGLEFRETPDGYVVSKNSDPEYLLNAALSYLALYKAYPALAAAAKQKEAKKAAKEAKAAEHTKLRTSEIALKALAHYNGVCSTSYTTWDDTNNGAGSSDTVVNGYIAVVGRAEATEAKKAAEKLAKRRDDLAEAIWQTDGEGCLKYGENSVVDRAVDLIIAAKGASGDREL